MQALAIKVPGGSLSTREVDHWSDLVSRLDRHRAQVRWPSAADAEDALSGVLNDAGAVYRFRDDRYYGVAEGRAYRLSVGAGAVALVTLDPARRERRKDNPTGSVAPLADLKRLQDGRVEIPAPRRDWDADLPHISAVNGGEAQWLGPVAAQAIAQRSYHDPSRSRGRYGSTIKEWSHRSRMRMLRAYAEIDYGPLFSQPGTPAMVTLTYPGRWSALAPDGVTVKKHFAAWVERFYREFGYRPALLWKLEFQRRGAPHFHLFMMCPAFTPSGVTFRAWLSRSWADVVGADPNCDSETCFSNPLTDRELDDHLPAGSLCSSEYLRHSAAGTNIDFGKASRVTSPRKIASYFLKHGTKTSDDKEYQHFVPKLWRDAGVSPGRFWGFQGLRKDLVIRDLDLDRFTKVRRTMRRHARAHGRRRCYIGSRLAGGWSLAGDGPRMAAALAESLCQTVVVPGALPGWREVIDVDTGEILRTVHLP